MKYTHPHDDEIAFFGATSFRNRKRKFGIKTDDRRRHMYVLGKTGMGKSTLLENMIASDIRAGHGLVVVDPHGDLAEKALSFVPPERINDTIYFDPIDVDRPIAFNVLEKVEPKYRTLVASGLVGVFKKIWADSWGPRLEYILTNTILALLDYESSTLLGINRMLVDKLYRQKVVEKISDPIVKAFWTNEFAKYNEKFAVEAIAPIQNKVGQFVSSAIIRNVVGQPKSTINMRDIMDNHKILILNLAKGKIGEETSALLGAMFITKIQLAAMSRADMPEDERLDFYMYVDEFQNFATESFSGILSEARKYRLNITLAHQYITQMEEPVRDAVFGNVGTLLIFRVGAADAMFMENEFLPVFEPTDLVNLEKYHFYIKLMINGVASNPFSAQGLPPVPVEDKSHIEKIKTVSRDRYGRDKATVEERIMRWINANELAAPRPGAGAAPMRAPYPPQAQQRSMAPTKFAPPSPRPQLPPATLRPPAPGGSRPAPVRAPQASRPSAPAVPQKPTQAAPAAAKPAPLSLGIQKHLQQQPTAPAQSQEGKPSSQQDMKPGEAVEFE